MHFTQLMLLAAAGVSAHPSGHAHMHRAVHEKRVQWITATIDGKVVSWTDPGSPFVQAGKPTPAPSSEPAAATTPAEAAPAAATPSSSPAADDAPADAASKALSGLGLGLSLFKPFGSCAAQKRSVAVEGLDKRATAGQISYKGNVGCDGYGSNIKLVKSNIASKYQYTVKVKGGSQSQQCKVWNKIGKDGGINGFFAGNEAQSFTLPANGEQHIAFDENTQGGMCCHPDNVPTTSWGEFLCPWLEFDFANASNGGWSGFDASALVAGSAGGPYRAMKVCTEDNSVCSSLDNNGGGKNAYLKGMEAADGIGGNLPAGPVSLIADYS